MSHSYYVLLLRKIMKKFWYYFCPYWYLFSAPPLVKSVCHNRSFEKKTRGKVCQRWLKKRFVFFFFMKRFVFFFSIDRNKYTHPIRLEHSRSHEKICQWGLNLSNVMSLITYFMKYWIILKKVIIVW